MPAFRPPGRSASPSCAPAVPGLTHALSLPCPPGNGYCAVVSNQRAPPGHLDGAGGRGGSWMAKARFRQTGPVPGVVHARGFAVLGGPGGDHPAGRCNGVRRSVRAESVPYAPGRQLQPGAPWQRNTLRIGPEFEGLNDGKLGASGKRRASSTSRASTCCTAASTTACNDLGWVPPTRSRASVWDEVQRISGPGRATRFKYENNLREAYVDIDFADILPSACVSASSRSCGARRITSALLDRVNALDLTWHLIQEIEIRSRLGSAAHPVLDVVQGALQTRRGRSDLELVHRGVLEPR